MNRRAAAMLAIPIATLLSTAAAAQAQPDTRRMLIGTAATATVKEVLLGPGVRVNAGELLVALDCRPIEAELEARRALLASSEALAERARNGPGSRRSRSPKRRSGTRRHAPRRPARRSSAPRRSAKACR